MSRRYSAPRREPRGPVRVSLSVAQLRMLGRIIRGAYLPLDRYRPENSTFAALERKGCIDRLQRTWCATNFGREVHAAGGKLYWSGDDGFRFQLPRERTRVVEYR